MNMIDAQLALAVIGGAIMLISAIIFCVLAKKSQCPYTSRMMGLTAILLFVGVVMCVLVAISNIMSRNTQTITVNGHIYERVEETKEAPEEIVIDGVTYRLVEAT